MNYIKKLELTNNHHKELISEIQRYINLPKYRNSDGMVNIEDLNLRLNEKCNEMTELGLITWRDSK